MNLLKLRQKYLLDEANVGAGLPIMSTILDTSSPVVMSSEIIEGGSFWHSPVID